MNLFKKIRKRLLLFRNYWITHFLVDLSTRIPKVRLPASWKKPISFIIWTINIVSWCTAIISFESKVVAVLVAAGFTLLTTAIGRNGFYFVSLVNYIPPNIEQLATGSDLQNTVGLILTLLPNVQPFGSCPCIAIVSDDINQLDRYYQQLLAMTGGRTELVQEYLRITIVLLDDSRYVFLCQPNPNNPDAQQFYESVERQERLANPADVHVRHHAFSPIRISASINRSDTRAFLDRYNSAFPLMITFYRWQNEEAVHYEPLPSFTLANGLSIKRRDQLTRNDSEFGLLEAMDL